MSRAGGRGIGEDAHDYLSSCLFDRAGNFAGSSIAFDVHQQSFGGDDFSRGEFVREVSYGFVGRDVSFRGEPSLASIRVRGWLHARLYDSRSRRLRGFDQDLRQRSEDRYQENEVSFGERDSRTRELRAQRGGVV